MQLFSSLKKSGIEEAERVIGAWLAEESVEVELAENLPER